ncbi:MAG: Rho termination factor N-terminal domain-containing protein [Solirubrobacteraceae bacterium]
MAAVLDRSELEASPLADLHAIADQLGLDGFRRLRKADLIGRILGDAPAADTDDDTSSDGDAQGERSSSRPRRRGGRSRRSGSAARGASADADQDGDDGADTTDAKDADDAPAKPARARGGRRERSRSARDDEQPAGGDDDAGAVAEGVVEVLGNGSAFLRIDPPEPSDADVYISAAQVRRCELVSGDRVSGPARTPRRSERYPSLVRVDTINGNPADSVSAGTRYDDLPVDYPSERLALESKDPTLEAIEWLTPFGRGSRVTIVGAPRAGKTETLRGVHAALAGRDGLEVSLVLSGARPEEIAQWQQASPAPAAALSFAASSDSQSQAVERAIEAAKRVAARGADAVVLIDGLDGLSAHAARKALAAARNLREGGSLTVIATASQPVGGESTVIALDVALTSTGRQPILDLAASGTLKPELLVGDDGAKAITQARATALDAG